MAGRSSDPSVGRVWTLSAGQHELIIRGRERAAQIDRLIIEPYPPEGAPTQTPGGPTATPAACEPSFTDVSTTEYFYEAVSYLYCAGDISGYSDSTFRPYNITTRGQLSKIIVLG